MRLFVRKHVSDELFTTRCPCFERVLDDNLVGYGNGLSFCRQLIPNGPHLHPIN